MIQPKNVLERLVWLWWDLTGKREVWPDAQVPGMAAIIVACEHPEDPDAYRKTYNALAAGEELPYEPEAITVIR